MRILASLLLFISSNVFALEAVVTVLEAPLFSSKSFNAPVVQYLRKGDVLKIHPSIANDKRFDQYAPSPEKLLELKYEKDANTFSSHDKFIPTLDRQGNTAYILSEHIYIYFNDLREFDQRLSKKDSTDYRLEEPLPKLYPLKSPSGYRGQLILGINQPYFESYPYKDNFKTKGYNSPMELAYSLSWQAPGKYDERLFIGATSNFRFFENTYYFYDQRRSEERGVKLGIGPVISYDAFKGIKNRLSISTSILVNFFDRLYITQIDSQSEEVREYLAYSIAPRVSLQYHRKAIIEDLDFVLGTAIEVGSPTTFRATNAGKNPLWWQDLGNDKFTTRTTFTLGGYVGMQTAY